MSRIKGPDGKYLPNPDSPYAKRVQRMIYRRESGSDRKLHPASELIAYIGDEGDSNYDIGARLGLQGSSVGRWKATDRYFTDAEADRWAIYLKVHPCEIWSTWWSSVELPEEELVG